MNPETAMQTAPSESTIAEWTSLLASLKSDIGDDDRCSDDPNDDQPGMQVTFGFTPETAKRDASWSYQTGDNSFTGGAYSHPYWGVVCLLRDSDAAELAREAAEEIADQVMSDQP